MYVNPTINFFANFYGRVIRAAQSLQGLFLLLLRLIWGQQFFLSGYGKLVNWDAAVDFFSSSQISHPNFVVLILALLELIGGILLVIGFATRLAALFLSCAMIYLLIALHTHAFEGFHFISDPSILVHQAPFAFLMASLNLFLFGPGRISLDAWIKRRSQHWKQY